MNQITERKTRTKDATTIDTDLVYRTETIPLLDVTYTEYSTDGDVWHKAYVETDIYMRTSVDNKATWVYYELTYVAPTETYTDTPATQTVGGIKAGDTFVAKTNQALWHDLTHAFLIPELSNFTMAQSLVEVGTTLTGIKTFTWSHTQDSNITPLSGILKEQTTVIATGIELINGTAAVSMTIPNTVPISKSYTIEGTDLELNTVISNAHPLTSIYPVFKGKFSSLGLTIARPVYSALDVANNLNRSVVVSTGDVLVTLNTLSDEYGWIAIPTTSDVFTKWFVDTDDKGEITGSETIGGSLFPSPVTANLTSPNGFWTNIPYRIYITNYPTSITNITLTR